MSKVLLVEIAATDRFHRAVPFPFVHSFLKTRSLGSRWVRFGVPADSRAGSGDEGFDLPDRDRPALDTILRAGDGPPTHVLLSHRLARRLLRQLTEAGPEVRVGFLWDGTGTADRVVEDGFQAFPVGVDPRSLIEFFGLPAEGVEDGDLFATVEPDFAWEAGNEEASASASLPFLLCAPECTYQRSLASNPWFRGLDLDGCDTRGGCAFCVRPPRDTPSVRPVAEVMARQLDGLARTHGPVTGRLAVRAAGEAFLKHVEAFAQMVLARPLPPCDFLLDGRADVLYARREHLRLALQSLEGSPHRIHVCLVGIENFSDLELERMNKGVSGLQNLDVIHALIDLERDYPGQFAFQQYGGLSLILSTPWTRPQDLAFNISLVEATRIAGWSGKVLSSRLRLYPGLPLHRLAEADGLLLDAYDDPRLDTARANLYQDEVPWRFQDPRMEPVGRILVRLSGAANGSDPLSELVARAIPPDSDPAAPLGFAMDVLDTAVSLDAARTPEDLLLRVVERVSAGGAQSGPGPGGGDGWPDHEIGRCTRFCALAVRAGIKPVARLEGEVARHWLDDPDPPDVQAIEVRVPTGGIDGSRGPSVWIGRDSGEVSRAIDQARRQLSSGQDERLGALIVEGGLLGYPDCCVTAFRDQDGPARDHYPWQLVRLRLRADDAISPLMCCHSLPLVEHIPCSLDCRPSLDRAANMLRAFREAEGDPAADRLVRAMHHPWMLVLTSENQKVELVPEDEPGERFRYRAGAWFGSDPLVADVLDGDEVVCDETGVNILKKGRLRAALGCRGFIWWHRAVVDRPLWTRLVDLRFAHRPEPRPMHWEQAGRQADGRDRANGLSRFVQAVLSAGNISLAGFRVESVRIAHGLCVRVDLASTGNRMSLLVEPHDPGRPFYLQAGSLSIAYPQDSPLDSPDKERAAHRAASLLEAALSARAIKGF